MEDVLEDIAQPYYIKFHSQSNTQSSQYNRRDHCHLVLRYGICLLPNQACLDHVGQPLLLRARCVHYSYHFRHGTSKGQEKGY